MTDTQFFIRLLSQDAPIALLAAGAIWLIIIYARGGR